MNQTKRHKLIARFQYMVSELGWGPLLTPEDHRLLARARELDPDPLPVPDDIRELDDAEESEHAPLIDLYKELRGTTAGYLLGILMRDAMQNKSALARMRPARAIEHVFIRERRSERMHSVTPTISVREFFDGNDDPRSINPRRAVVDAASFKQIKSILMDISTKEGVAAAGVGLDDAPTDSEAEADRWPLAGEIFVWTSHTQKEVRSWVKPLQPTTFWKVALRDALAPDEIEIPRKTVVFKCSWD
jgi:hypothetical protein